MEEMLKTCYVTLIVKRCKIKSIKKLFYFLSVKTQIYNLHNVIKLHNACQ